MGSEMCIRDSPTSAVALPTTAVLGLRAVPCPAKGWPREDGRRDGNQGELVREVGGRSSLFLLKSDRFNIQSRGCGPALLLHIPGKEAALGQDLLVFPFSLCQEKLLDFRGKQNR